MILAVVGFFVLALCLALVIAVARDPGPRPDSVHNDSKSSRSHASS